MTIGEEIQGLAGASPEMMTITEEEIQGVAGASPEMMMITEEEVDTVAHVPDLEIGTVGNVNLVTLHPVPHVINVMHPKTEE